ncbi:hypothetical protein SAMN04487944_12266 [Gracilibacillus ureilyticus]|uniref:DUF4252 domain-containing protein n=1 Tax=Gracilibacillus ureilyticus TaxID=531814 RepID=A0A1H9V9Z3_9BACI|nr:hypothetical protein [Gracilibacillus ureilyticus]SES18596.1 hypothetical protein SAMN04487944_12266 [Gracilibacillus ureilyticus]
MKKAYLILFIMIIFLSACNSNTWVLEKDRLSETGSVKDYVEQLQNDQTDFRGFRVFTISEGKKMVVVSTGTSNQTLEFIDANVADNSTTITVEGKSSETDEENAYILIGIDEIKGELSVVSESGETYSEYE